MSDENLLDMLQQLTDSGIIPEIYLRNFKINQLYIELINNGISCKQARKRLSKEFFTSEKNIEYIIYDYRKKQA